MSIRGTKPAALVALVLSLTAPGALALTAEEVWADWQRLGRDGQTEIAATARREGDRLVLTDLSFPIGTPADLSRVRLQRIELQDLPDGRVAVRLPDRFPVVIAGTRTGTGEPKEVTLSASAPDFSMIVSDLADRAAFEITAPSLVLTLEKVVPVPRPDERVDLNLAVADLSVRHRMDLAQPTTTIASAFSVGTLHADMLIDLNDGGQDLVDVAMDVSALSWTLDLVAPPSARTPPLAEASSTRNPLPDLLTALADGLVMRTELSHGPFALRTDIDNLGEVIKMDVRSASGKASARFDAASAGYGFAIGESAVSVLGGPPNLEFRDVSLSLTELSYGVSVGIGDLISPQEARLSARVVDLAVPPEVWAKADPTGALGATPLTFSVDLVGRYALAPEMLEPDWKPTPGTFPPADFIEASLSGFLFSGFGVRITGEGALVFDETDLVTFEGMPAPEGKLSFRATGINALIDRVVAAGLVPSTELTGLRFGLAFIAKPGDGPDSLVSEVEFREKGFYLNGLKLR
jgi:hypothetical protein